MGTFSDPRKTTWTGFLPGSVIPEFRIVTADHKTKLNVRDTVKLAVK